MTKVTSDKILFEIFIWYSSIDILVTLLIPALSNKIFILVMIYFYLYYNIKIASKEPVKFIINNLMLFIYCCYGYLNSGLYYITHADFYAYVGMMYVMLIVLEPKIIEIFEKFVTRHIRQCKYAIVLFLAVLIISVLVQNGITIDNEVGGIVIKGPYYVAHELAYELTFLYCLSAIAYRKTKEVFYLIFKAIALVGVMFTGARSAFLALAILVVIDYFTMKNISMKWLMLIFGMICFLYLALCTDVLINNPIVQKTLTNISEGSISNNRDRFRDIVLSNYLNETSTIQKIFGMGIDGVRNALKSDPMVKVGIHAHNDYINLLCGYGIIGVMLFVIMQIKMLKYAKGIWQKFLAFSFLFVLIYTNGLAMYTMVTPMMAIYILFIKQRDMMIAHNLRGRLNDEINNKRDARNIT